MRTGRGTFAATFANNLPHGLCLEASYVLVDRENQRVLCSFRHSRSQKLSGSSVGTPLSYNTSSPWMLSFKHYPFLWSSVRKKLFLRDSTLRLCLPRQSFCMGRKRRKELSGFGERRCGVHVLFFLASVWTLCPVFREFLLS